MKTEDLMTMLANNAGPAPKALALKSLSPALLLGPLMAAAVAVAVLGLIPQHMFGELAVWAKLGYAGTLALIGGVCLARLGKPGARIGMPPRLLPLLAALVALVGVGNYLSTPPEQLHQALFGGSFLVCPWAILTLSVPALALSLWAARQLAPTRPLLTGAACGLMSGGLGAMGYALACTETSLTFISIWYTAGMLLCTALGALLGRRFLRW